MGLLWVAACKVVGFGVRTGICAQRILMVAQLDCSPIIQSQMWLCREGARWMFYHAFNSYMTHAFPKVRQVRLWQAACCRQWSGPHQGLLFELFRHSSAVDTAIPVSTSRDKGFHLKPHQACYWRKFSFHWCDADALLSIATLARVQTTFMIFDTFDNQ